MTSQAVRVAIVSAHEVVATGIAGMLSHHPARVEVVGLETGVGVADPDVILYDAVGLHDADGQDLMQLVTGTTSAVLAVSRDLRPDLASRALALGCDGYFSIGVDDAALLAAVESATSGWVPGDAGANPTVGSSDAEAVELRLGHEVGLTGRESDVVAMITQGLTNQEIAEKCYLSINSVKTYIRSAYRRIGVTSRSQAVVWALQHGFTADHHDE